MAEWLLLVIAPSLSLGGVPCLSKVARNPRPHYALHILPAPRGCDCRAFAIDAAAAVAGEVRSKGLWRAVRWRERRLEWLADPGRGESCALAINDHGWTAGWISVSRSGAHHACEWAPGGFRDLGTLGGKSSEARGIADDGTVVGTAQTLTGEWHAFLWRRGRMFDLNRKARRPAGYVLKDANAISPTGMIVGFMVQTYIGLYGSAAYLIKAGHVYNLGVEQAGTVGRVPGTVSFGLSDAYAVSRTGMVAGMEDGSHVHAMLRTEHKNWYLGALGGIDSEAYGVNDAAEAVGYGDTRKHNGGSSSKHALLFSRGRVWDLNRLMRHGPCTLIDARGIDDSGWIAANSYCNGRERAVLMVPG